MELVTMTLKKKSINKYRLLMIKINDDAERQTCMLQGSCLILCKY